MPYLYGGKILRIDLTRHEARAVPTENYASKFIGGRSLNARLLYEAIDANTDPLGPGNILCFGPGPLTGTTFPMSSRVEIMCKSPVTGLLAHANMGGDWAAEVKHAGWDAIVLEGKSPEPVYVYIHNDKVEFRDAKPYWGKTTYATQAALRNDFGNQNLKVACIGPAGENLVTFASINGGVAFSAARTGVGTVMGSKNCKAIAVRGTKGVKVADPDAFVEACGEAQIWIRSQEAYDQYHAVGSSPDETAYARAGVESSGDEHATAPSYDDEFDFVAFYKKYGYKRTGCVACPVHCMDCYNIPGIGATAVKCENYPQLSAEWRQFDMMFMFKMVLLVEEQGLDTTSISTTFLWLMHLTELGIIDESITGHRLTWGNTEAAEALIWDVIHRKGFGDAVAQGMRAAADYIDARVPAEKRDGQSTYYYAMQVNNNPMFPVSPRIPGEALGHAIGRRSDQISDINMCDMGQAMTPVYPDWLYPDERKAEYIAWFKEDALRYGGTPEAAELEGYRGKAAVVIDTATSIAFADMLGTCKWQGKFAYLFLTEADYAKALSAGLGRKVEPEDLIEAARRMNAMERALECKLGRSRKTDTIPDKEFDKPLMHGMLKGKLGTSREGLERMKSEYYLIRGYDLETGIPCKETLLEYGLDDVAVDLDAMGILPVRTIPDQPKAMKDPTIAWRIMDEEEKRIREAGKQERKAQREAERPEVAAG